MQAVSDVRAVHHGPRTHHNWKVYLGKGILSVFFSNFMDFPYFKYSIAIGFVLLNFFMMWGANGTGKFETREFHEI